MVIEANVIAPIPFHDDLVLDLQRHVEGRGDAIALILLMGELLRITFVNGSGHPHTIHFHGIHPAEMDGVPGIGAGQIEAGKSTVYEFDALPAGLHLYHCHVRPLAEHIAKGLYGAFIVDPKDPREDADEMVMVMNGFDTNFDNENEIYAVNTVAFHYQKNPIRIRQGELIRAYTAARLTSARFTTVISSIAVERIFAHHGLTIFDVEELPTHGGSLRIYAGHPHDHAGQIRAARGADAA